MGLSTKYKPMKGDPTFDKEMEDIIRTRYGKGLDSKPSGRHLIQKKLTKHPSWPIIKRDLSNVIFTPEDKRGQFAFSIFNIFIFAIFVFVTVILFAGYIYITGLINTSFHDVGLQNEVNSGQPGYVNLTNAADITFGEMNSSIGGLRMVSVTLIFSVMLAMVLTNFFVKIHPMFFFVYVLVIVLAVIFSAPVANAYEVILNSGIYNNGLWQFTGANFILLNLPTVIAVMGILGGILLFINILRSENERLPV